MVVCEYLVDAQSQRSRQVASFDPGPPGVAAGSQQIPAQDHRAEKFGRHMGFATQGRRLAAQGSPVWSSHEAAICGVMSRRHSDRVADSDSSMIGFMAAEVSKQTITTGPAHRR